MRHNVRQTTRGTNEYSPFRLSSRIVANAETVAKLLDIPPLCPVRESDIRRKLATILADYGSAMLAEFLAQ